MRKSRTSPGPKGPQHVFSRVLLVAVLMLSANASAQDIVAGWLQLGMPPGALADEDFLGTGRPDIEEMQCLEDALKAGTDPLLHAAFDANMAQAEADLGPVAAILAPDVAATMAFYATIDLETTAAESTLAYFVDGVARELGAPGICGNGDLGCADAGTCDTSCYDRSATALAQEILANCFGEPFPGPAPSVTLNQQAGQDDPTWELPILFDVVFSEPVAGFDDNPADDVDVVFGGTATDISFTVEGKGAVYTLSVTVAGLGGTIIPSIPADVARSASGTSNSASTSTDGSVVLIWGSDPDSPLSDPIPRTPLNPWPLLLVLGGACMLALGRIGFREDG